MYKLYGKFVYEPDRASEYKTTVHAINSFIIKLAYYTIPAALQPQAVAQGIHFNSQPRKLYRGVCGKLYDSAFLFGDTVQRGAVSQGFMSLSRKREVAEGYAANSKGKLHPSLKYIMVVEEKMCDRGADVAWLSQYPGEDEKLIGPLAALQIESCEVDELVDPTDSSKKHQLIVMRLRFNVNQMSQPLEKLKSQRRTLLLLTLKQASLTQLSLKSCVSPLVPAHKYTNKTWYQGAQTKSLVRSTSLPKHHIACTSAGPVTAQSALSKLLQEIEFNKRANSSAAWSSQFDQFDEEQLVEEYHKVSLGHTRPNCLSRLPADGIVLF